MKEVTDETGRPKNRLVNYLIYALVLVPGLYVRLLAMEDALPRSLEKDSWAFYTLASSPVSLWAAGEREPFFLLLHRLALLAFHGAPWAIRLQSFLFSIVLIFLVTRISLRLCRNRFLAAVPGWLICFTPFMAFSATRGLRLEIFLCLVLGLQAILSFSPRPLSIRRAVPAGILAGALCLTRGIGVFIALGIFGTAFLKWGGRDGFKPAGARIAPALLLAFALAFPFYFNQHRRYGSAFYISRRDATFFRNQEFLDQPGFPSSREVAQDPYTGALISPREYIFGLHHPCRALLRILQGYVRAFTFYYSHALGRWWALLFLAAAGIPVLIRRGWWEWALLFFLVLFPFSFIIPISVSGHQSVDARFAMHGYPVVCLFMGAGLEGISSLFLRRHLVFPAGKKRDEP